MLFAIFAGGIASETPPPSHAVQIAALPPRCGLGSATPTEACARHTDRLTARPPPDTAPLFSNRKNVYRAVTAAERRHPHCGRCWFSRVISLSLTEKLLLLWRSLVTCWIRGSGGGCGSTYYTEIHPCITIVVTVLCSGLFSRTVLVEMISLVSWCSGADLRM